MITKLNVLIILFGFWVSSYAQPAKKQNKNLNQQIYADIDVATSMISIVDTMYIPKVYFSEGKDFHFELNKNLDLVILSKGFNLSEKSEDSGAETLAKAYILSAKQKLVDKTVMLIFKYSGKIVDEIKKAAAEYARGFSETKGTITEKGVYLAGSTYWLPSYGENVLSSFNLTVKIDSAWNVVSQGKRTINKIEGAKRLVKYHSPEPMDEVYLIAAKWTEYTMPAGNVTVQAFLRSPDKKLAYKYLGVTSGYLDMYNKLIGPYPYTKFALVENFWETGYGMPSFTLLGEKVIRMPWILYSSYPHELLHNYWGNGVFVDYSTGNWCEGITVYMADHLLQEQRGSGATYRRNTLQKFTDYVNNENDFAVNKFLNRNNSAEEAIGYGKVMMINNMLRWEFGDKAFLEAYSKFYKDYKFRKASFADIQKTFETITGKDLTAFFAQWVDRKGAPTIKLSTVSVKKKKNKYHLSFTLNQIQKEEVFDINIPVFVYLEGKATVVDEKINMNKKEQKFTFTYDKKPVRIDIDPQFQIMRRLDRKEVPASLTQVFGEKEAVIILPENSKHLTAFTAMAKMWQKMQAAQGKKVSIVPDNKIDAIPGNKAVWIFGFENKFSKLANISEKYNTNLGSEKINQINKLKKEGALVFALTNPNNINYTVGFVGANNDVAIKALSGKLLHYGKYGYLGFETEKANNVLKGSLPALDSPMNYIIDDKAEIKAVIVPRKDLTEAK
jgi:hypothetical protein